MNVAWGSRCINMLYARCYLRSPSWIMHLTRPRYLADKYPPPPRLRRRDSAGAIHVVAKWFIRPAFHIISVKVPWNIASNSRKKTLAFFSIVIFLHRPIADRSSTIRDPPLDAAKIHVLLRARVKIRAIVNRNLSFSRSPSIFQADQLNQIIP